MARLVEAAARALIETGRRFYARGWVLGTSGNFSVVLGRRPLRLAVTASGVSKGDLTRRDILEVDAEGRPAGRRRPSAEVRLHLAIARARAAGAVLHTHSVWSTIVSEPAAARSGLELGGYEMLKGLAGVVSHEHREWLPVVENDQDMQRLAGEIGSILDRPGLHGFLIRRHGLYTWGADLPEAVRHVEILEFLLEVIGRESGYGSGKNS